MRPAAQKFKRPQRTPPPPAAVASRCARCCGEIDEDDEFLVDLCMACDRLRHRELAAAKRSAEKDPVSPDSVMAGLHAMRVGRPAAVTVIDRAGKRAWSNPIWR